MLVCIIDEVENLLPVSALINILTGKFADMEIVSFLYHRRYLGIFLRNGIWHHQFILYILIIYGKTLQSLDVLRII